jgi:hypothetical protein
MEHYIKKIQALPNSYILIATPCYGGMCYSNYVQSLFGVITTLQQIGVQVEFSLLGGESLISRARNAIVAQFMSKPYTHLLFLDADLVFEPESVLRLLASNLEFCGAIYPKKAINWQRVKAGEFNIEKMSDLNVNRLEGEEPVAEYLKVKHLATGFMCLKKSVIETLIYKHPDRKYRNNVAGYNAQAQDWFYDLFAVGVVDGEYLSEDYYFCHLAREAGIEIWADIKTKLGHIGQMTFWGTLQNQLEADGLDADAICA